LNHSRLQRSVDRPSHHSFPTRRSSDLHVLWELRVLLCEVAPVFADDVRRHRRELRQEVVEVHDEVLEDRKVREGIDRHGASVDIDRKSTRLNSSHVSISYAVFCLKKKK